MPKPIYKKGREERALSAPEDKDRTSENCCPFLKKEQPETLESESTFIIPEGPKHPVPERSPVENQLLTCKNILIFTIALALIISFTVMGVYVHQNKTDISKISTKSVMSFEPTAAYLESEDRQMVVKWRLVEEDSQNPFPYLNDTHILFEKDGLYQISVQLQMETEEEVFNIITLYVHLNNIHDKPIMSVKERYPSNRNFNSIQLQPKPRYFKQGDTIHVTVTDPKYLSKDASMSYLTIVEQ